MKEKGVSRTGSRNGHHLLQLQTPTGCLPRDLGLRMTPGYPKYWSTPTDHPWDTYPLEDGVDLYTRNGVEDLKVTYF